MKNGSRASSLYLPLLCLLGAMLAGSVLLASNKRRAEAHEASVRAEALRAGPLVEIATVAPAPATRSLTLSGEARAFRQTTLYAKVSGYLKMVRVDKGDRVRDGEVLGVIEAPEVEQQVASKRADLDIKKLTEERYQGLADTGVISQQERDQAQADVRIASADLLALNALRGYEVIRAPFAGVITARYADPGALLQAATSSENALALVDVAEIDRVRIFVYLGQNEALFVHEGDPVSVYTEQFPDKKIAATITRFSRELDTRTRTMLTEIDVDNRAAGFLPGIYVRVDFSIPAPPAMEVPADALVFRNGGAAIAVEAGGRAKFVAIEAGDTDGKFVRVTRGVEAGDRVILHPGDDVADGSPVRVATK